MTITMEEANPRLTRDMAKAAETLGLGEVRFLVDQYYQWQRYRISCGHQARTSDEIGEPHTLVSWAMEQNRVLEGQIKRAMDRWTMTRRDGRWARSITGVGPVIAAGLLAHIDIRKAPTVGHIWRFAGLDPTVTWGKGQKRPWNADLKVLCWKLGESFVKVKGRESDVYGKVYEARKAIEAEKNAAGEYADQAAATLERTPKHAQRAVYAEGRLPDGRIHMRCQRYAVKLFLSHLHHVMYECEFGEAPPKPYVIEHGGHVHFVAPPGWPME